MIQFVQEKPLSQVRELEQTKGLENSVSKSLLEIMSGMSEHIERLETKIEKLEKGAKNG
ncbi:MAG: hypothetical protein Q4A78_03070 [Peptostreptococcaceae bacterium]|nr:hypothetical protein [Peptostreptococcaceae bacterium]